MRKGGPLPLSPNASREHTHTDTQTHRHTERVRYREGGRESERGREREREREINQPVKMVKSKPLRLIEIQCLCSIDDMLRLGSAGWEKSWQELEACRRSLHDGLMEVRRMDGIGLPTWHRGAADTRPVSVPGQDHSPDRCFEVSSDLNAPKCTTPESPAGSAQGSRNEQANGCPKRGGYSVAESQGMHEAQQAHASDTTQDAVTPLPEDLVLAQGKVRPAVPAPAPAHDDRKWFLYKLRRKIQEHAAKAGVGWEDVVHVLDELGADELRSCLEQGDVSSVRPRTPEPLPTCACIVTALPRSEALLRDR